MATLSRYAKDVITAAFEKSVDPELVSPPPQKHRIRATKASHSRHKSIEFTIHCTQRMCVHLWCEYMYVFGVFVYIHVYVHGYIYVYIHTHTHTRMIVYILMHMLCPWKSWLLQKVHELTGSEL